jgi:hypothetical protein
MAYHFGLQALLVMHLALTHENTEHNRGNPPSSLGSRMTVPAFKSKVVNHEPNTTPHESLHDLFRK